MKNALIALSLLGSIGLAASASAADLPSPAAPVLSPVVAPFFPVFKDKEPPVVLQLGPTTDYSTISCANFTKLPDGTWQAIAPVPFGLGFVQGIIPPLRPIKVGGYIYNNIDLASQLNAQCGAGAVVTAKY